MRSVRRGWLRTITTGDVVSEEAAGEWALEVFASRWHPIIRQALAYRRHEPDTGIGGDLRECGEFVVEVIDTATLDNESSTERAPTGVRSSNGPF